MHAAVVLDPHQINLINKLENVQKFALRAATKQWKANYVDLLSVCQVPSLAQRRQYLKLTTLFQINKSLIIIPDAPVHSGGSGLRCLGVIICSCDLYS